MGSDASIRSAVGSAVVVFSVCMAFVALTPARGVWVVDNGARALMAQRLLDTGGVALPHPGGDLDPDGAAFPIRPPYGVRIGDAWYSQYPVAYPALAAPFLALMGPIGLRVPAALGTALAAGIVAWWAASVLGATVGLGAGLATGLATPLFFHGVTVWDHALTTGLALAACLLASRSSAPRLVAAGAVAGLACWLRAELAIFGLALAIGVFLERRNARDVGWLAAGALPMALVLLGLHLWIYGDPLGPHVSGNVGVNEATARAGAAGLARRVGALLAAHGGSLGAHLVWVAAAAAAVGGGALAARAGRSALALGIATPVGVVASIHAARHVATASSPYLALPYYNGLLPQVPWCALAGIGAVHLRREAALRPLRLPVTVGVAFLALMIPFRVGLSDFFTGGAWGPRMLMPAVPALMLLAVAACGVGVSRRVAGTAVAALALAALYSTGVSAWLLAGQKAEVAHLESVLRAAPQPVIVTDHPALAQQLPGLWGEKTLLWADGRTLSRTLGRARARGLDRFLLVRRPMRRTSPGSVPGAECTPLEPYRGTRAPVVFDLERLECRMRRPRGAIQERTP
jgi:hypothetical protein